MRALALLALLVLGLDAVEDPRDRLAAATARAHDERHAAIAELKDLVLDEPGLHAAHYNLGCLLLDDDHAAAARHLQHAADAPLPELRARALHNLALARHHLGQLESALEAAAEALAAAPDSEAFRQTHDELRRILLERRDAARREAARPRLAERELPPAWVGEAWRGELSGTGGAGGPYGFSVAEGRELPPGLALEQGAISGTPTSEAEGDHQLALVISDAEDATGADRAHLVVLPTPAIVTDELPPAVRGLPYRAELRSQGMLGARWSASGLPAGIRIEGRGELAELVGTPDTVGDHRVRVTVEDPYHRVERELALDVGPTFAPARTRLDPATAWHPYHQRCTVRGPEDDYVWAGEPVGGLRIAADGGLSGVPETAGELELPVTITNSSGETVDANLKLTVNPPPVIESGQTIELHRARSADEAIASSGGTRPLRWQAVGPLPPGLELTPAGRLTGLPAEIGESSPVLRLEDHWDAATEAPVTIRISEPPPEQQQQDEQQQQGEQGEQQQDEQQQGDQGQQQQGEQQQGEQGEQQDEQGEQQDEQGEQQGEQGEQQPDEGRQGDPPPREPDEPDGDAGAKADAARQAQRLDQAAARRWLRDLPEEESGIEMFLLPEHATPRPRGGDQAW